MRFARIVKILLIAVPLLLVAVAVGGIAVLKGTDFNEFKPEIAAQVKQATGRDLSIQGNLTVEVSLNPAITVDGVTFANAAWGSRPEMVKLDRLEAQVAVLPLLFGRVMIDRLVLEGADILLEVNGDGQANFDFGESEKVASDGGGGAEIPVGAREVAVRNSVLTYSNGVTGVSYRTQVDLMELAGEGMDEPVRLSFEGAYNEAPIRVGAKLGTPSTMLSPENPWPVDMTIEAGGATIKIEGTIAEPATASGIDLDVAITGDELGELSAVAGAEIPRLGAYSLFGNLKGDAASSLSLSDFEAKIADSDLQGNIEVRLDADRPVLSGDLRSERIDLAALGGGPGKGGGAKGDKVFPADPLPLEAMRALDVEVRMDGKTVLIGGAALREATLGLSLKGGSLTVKPINGILAEGSLDGSLRLDARAKTGQLSAAISLNNMDLGRLMKELGASGEVNGQAIVKLDVEGAGGSVAGIMAGLNGEASLLMGKGRMRSAALNTLIGGPTQVLGNILTGSDNDYTVINCAVVRLPVRKGVATAEPIVLDTDVATFVGKGTIDLGTEKLDLRIDPDVKKTTISAAVPVEIGGTLARPEYSLEKLGVARKVGGLLGVVMFPPAAIIGLGELGLGDDNPCIQQAKSGAQQDAGEESGGSGNILKDAGEGITKGLKGLFGD